MGRIAWRQPQMRCCMRRDMGRDPGGCDGPPGRRRPRLFGRVRLGAGGAGPGRGRSIGGVAVAAGRRDRTRRDGRGVRRRRQPGCGIPRAGGGLRHRRRDRRGHCRGRLWRGGRDVGISGRRDRPAGLVRIVRRDFGWERPSGHGRSRQQRREDGREILPRRQGGVTRGGAYGLRRGSRDGGGGQEDHGGLATSVVRQPLPGADYRMFTGTSAGCGKLTRSCSC